MPIAQLKICRSVGKLKKKGRKKECKTNAISTETIINANKVSYGYDGKDRIISIDYASSSNGVKGLHFTYNIHGWLTKVDAINENNNEKVMREYTYTNDGKVSIITDYVDFLSGTGKWLKRTYTYDKFNRPIHIAYTDNMSGSSTDVKESYTYTYDAANRLKTATGKTGNIVDYVQENKYNGFGQRVQKKEGSDVTNYFYDGTAVLYATNASDIITSFNLVGAEDNILSTARGAGNQTNFYVYTKDIRESTSNIIGNDGQAEVSYSYDIYGETTEYQSDVNNPFYNEICYTAGVYDATTGLYNLNARYYSPAAGTFLT